MRRRGTALDGESVFGPTLRLADLFRDVAWPGFRELGSALAGRA